MLEEYDESSVRVGEVVGGVDLDEGFAGEPHGGDVAVGRTSCESDAQPFPALVGEVVPGE